METAPIAWGSYFIGVFMKGTAILFIIVAIIAAVIGFKLAIGLAALIAKVFFGLALVIGIALFVFGVREGEKLAS